MFNTRGRKAGLICPVTLPVVRESPQPLRLRLVEQADHAVLEKDLSELCFVTDRRLTKAILEDMRTESKMACTSEAQDVREWQGRHLSEPLRLNLSINKGDKGRNHGDPPAARTKTRTFVANVLPELMRLSPVVDRYV